MPNENLKPAPASNAWLTTLDQPIQHPAHIQEFLERNRRDLLCSALLFKPEEISGRLIDTRQGPGMRVCLQNTELDKKYKNPRPPVTVEGTLTEWQAEFELTPRLLLKLTPLLQKIAPHLLPTPAPE